jgi:hypothetical protein
VRRYTVKPAPNFHIDRPGLRTPQITLVTTLLDGDIYHVADLPEREAAEMTPDYHQALRTSNEVLSLVLQSRQKFSHHEVIIGDMLTVHQR